MLLEGVIAAPLFDGDALARRWGSNSTLFRQRLAARAGHDEHLARAGKAVGSIELGKSIFDL